MDNRRSQREDGPIQIPEPNGRSLPSGTIERQIAILRATEYPQLKDAVYLDHGGTTLYARTLIENFSADLITNLYGNPHSESAPSAHASSRVEETRLRALQFFNASPEHWDLVFVANTTAAIKTLMECFRDYGTATRSSIWYGYHKDAHTSLVGARELADKHRCFAADLEVDDWIRKGCVNSKARRRQLGLFAYPGQSNMTGRRLPLKWCSEIRQANKGKSILTLLDAAALASTARIDLSNPSESPDFVALSFYKIFGFPDLGALLVQKERSDIFERRNFFGGGTVEMVISVGGSWHAKKTSSIHDQLEDGTLPFHSIIALDHAMTVHKQLYGTNPMRTISNYTAELGLLLHSRLSALRHHNGRPVVLIYTDTVAGYGKPQLQGATLALNIVRANGSLVGYTDVEKAASEQSIYIRSGSLCNPGGFASYLGWSPRQMKAAFAAGHRCSHPTQVVHGKPTGVVRVSLGAMSTLCDVEAFVEFIRQRYVGAEQAQIPAIVPPNPSVSKRTVLGFRVAIATIFSRTDHETN